MRALRLIIPTCIAILSGLLASGASAAVVSFELELDSDAVGDASTSSFITKNGVLLGSENQTIEMDLGDTLSIQIEVVARGMAGEFVTAFGEAFLFGGLIDTAAGAEVHARYSARVDARGDEAFTDGAFVYACVAVTNCITDALPFGDAAILSDTVAGNAELVDDVLTPLPGFGGVLDQTVDRLFSLPAGGLPGATFINFGIVGESGLFDNGATAGAAFVTLDVEVGPIIPIPAAVWLFGSALGLLGLVRSRSR